MSFFNKIRMSARNVGVECQRANAYTIPEFRLYKYLCDYNIRTVLDVGANDGGYASALFDAGFDGAVYSMEPMPDAWEKLCDRASRTHPNWHVLSPVAVGNREDSVEFNIAGNSVSSSLLKMTSNLVSAKPESAIKSSVNVKMRRLDDILSSLDDISPAYLKVDVQGAERLVLEGAEHALSTCVVGIQLEMSLVELYEGQSTAFDIYDHVVAQGFQLWDIIPGFRHSQTFQLMQFDGVFFKVSA